MSTVSRVVPAAPTQNVTDWSDGPGSGSNEPFVMPHVIVYGPVVPGITLAVRPHVPAQARVGAVIVQSGFGFTVTFSGPPLHSQPLSSVTVTLSVSVPAVPAV